MTFLEPARLVLLAAVPLLVAGYLLVQRRRRRYAVRFAALPLLARVAPRRPGWRRHAPAVAFLLMASALIVGFARPEAEVRVPREEATVIVALDTSGSMKATDVEPDRFTVARQAAKDFVRLLPERFNVGVVSFAGTARMTVPPTTDHRLVQQGLDSLTMSGGTAIGDALAASVDSVRLADDVETEGQAAGTELPPARIVLLSDGANSEGRPVEEGVQIAREANVAVSTIAYGTPEGEIQAGSRVLRVPVDEAALEEIAVQTGGDSYAAASADELRDVYADLGSSIGYRLERQEVTAWFVGAGLVLAMLAAAGSLLWFARLP